MSEPKWDALGKKVEPRWGPERDRSVRRNIERRSARRRAVTGVGASIGALVLVAGIVRAMVGQHAQAPVSSLAASSEAPAAAGAGVTVTQLSPDAIIEPIADRNGRGFALRAGSARFTARHDSEHPLVVVAGDVVIEDLGTTFTVAYVGDGVEVAVEEGRVSVRARGAVVEVGEGERRQFAFEPTQAPVAKTSRAPAAQASSSWRPLAESGRYDEAHAALQKAGPNAVRDETGDLLLAADAARLSGFPAEAVPYLERVLRAHSSDPRSGLAAFTLGRVLLDELGRPREAAEAFARSRSAGGPLAEDALARQVEATSRAGDTAKSRDLAREYFRLYPKGRRAKAVSKFGGLD